MAGIDDQHLFSMWFLGLGGGALWKELESSGTSLGRLGESRRKGRFSGWRAAHGPGVTGITELEIGPLFPHSAGNTALL